MTNSLYKKHIISIPELSRAELELIVKTAGQLKAEPNPETDKEQGRRELFLRAFHPYSLVV
ncbi:aspartate carbamoyltransferase catalytic subunit [Vibrio vulnificus]|nr:aspartate carbamoyltransferase catalytic subunit [Vibrio vulnificus]